MISFDFHHIPKLSIGFKDLSVISLIVLTNYLFFVVETSMTISSMNIKKWHKRDFALPHKTYHNSWFTKANDMIKKATERTINMP